MRLTLDHLRRAPQFTNAILQREIDLRGMRISSLDEHTLTLLDDAFDVINLTSNALTALEYFPTSEAAATSAKSKLTRVTALIAHQNHIQKVSISSCAQALPNVMQFMADGNRLGSVRDMLFLKYWKKLEMLSVKGNPVMNDNPEDFDEKKLRAFFVFLCPSLKLINYARVLQADRDMAASLKKEFRSLVAQWEGDGPVVTADGRKIRKRGRENRERYGPGGRPDSNPIVKKAKPEPVEEEEIAGVADTPTTIPAPSEPSTASPAVAAAPPPPETAPAAAVESEEDGIQARLDELEARILSDDITPEQIDALEQEMSELTARLERRKRPR